MGKFSTDQNALKKLIYSSLSKKNQEKEIKIYYDIGNEFYKLWLDDPLAKKEFVTAKDLAGLPVIMARRTHVQNELSNWFGEYFKDLNILFRSNLPTNGAIMVQEGLGYAMVVRGLADSLWDKDKICFRPLHPELSATTVLAWKRQQPFSRAAEKFIEHMKSFFA